MADNLTTNQKIALGALLGAAVCTVIGYKYYSGSGEGAPKKKVTKRRSSKKSSSKAAAEAKSKESTKGKKEAAADESSKVTSAEKDILQRASVLKEEGNNAYKNRDYDLAIQKYTEALALTDVDAHVFYSNRSATYMALEKYESAKADAQKCMELKPMWSKGYFRMGKAEAAMGNFELAFQYFYKGLKLDPKSEELKKVLDTVRQELGIGELDTRAILDTKMIKYYLAKSCEKRCKENLNIDFDVFQGIMKKALESQSLDSVLDMEPLDRASVENFVDTCVVVALALVEHVSAQLGTSGAEIEAAYKYAKMAYDRSPKNIVAIQTLVNTILRQKNGDFMKAKELTEQGLEIDPKNVLLSHTYASIVLRLNSLMPMNVITIKEFLSKLRVGLDNPQTNHLLIADSGIRLWFKLFEDPHITQQLVAEENNNRAQNIPPKEAYLKGLTDGAFGQLCLEPFFMQSLSQVIFNNPGLEKVLSPFRTAFALEDATPRFKQLAPLIHAIALQCWRNNYAWEVDDEEEKRVYDLKTQVAEMLKDVDTAVNAEGELNDELSHHLTVISMYQPLYDLDGIEDVVKKVNLQKLNKWFAQMLKMSVMNHAIESELIENMKPLTEIPSTPLIEWYNNHVNVWDSAGLVAGRLVKIPLQKELEWIFPKFKPTGFDAEGKVKMLVAGCGSGSEVYQMSTLYENVDITAVDISSANLAYAIRQNRELGDGDTKFYLADLTQLKPDAFEHQFDFIVANSVLHFFSDIEAWKNLTALLRPGGLMRVSVYSKRFIDLLKDARTFLIGRFPKPLFTSSNRLPKVQKTANKTEIRKARGYILDSDIRGLDELITTPAFYSLSDFTDLVFHPSPQGFTFETIGKCLEELGLKLVGFEFPGISQETILKYRLEYPDDPNFTSFENLDKFDNEHPDAFKNFLHTITFVCEKPVEQQ